MKVLCLTNDEISLSRALLWRIGISLARMGGMQAIADQMSGEVVPEIPLDLQKTLDRTFGPIHGAYPHVSAAQLRSVSRHFHLVEGIRAKLSPVTCLTSAEAPVLGALFWRFYFAVLGISARQAIQMIKEDEFEALAGDGGMRECAPRPAAPSARPGELGILSSILEKLNETRKLN